MKIRGKTDFEAGLKSRKGDFISEQSGNSTLLVASFDIPVKYSRGILSPIIRRAIEQLFNHRNFEKGK